jgi:hypothetical protein
MQSDRRALSQRSAVVSEHVMAWVRPLFSQLNPNVTPAPESPFCNISDEIYSEAIELALDRLEKRGEYREPLASEIDSAIEDLVTDPDYRERRHG